MPGPTQSTDRPAVEVRIGGQPVEPRLAQDVIEVDVSEEVNKHARCTLLVQNWDPDQRVVRWSDSGPLVPGAEVEVALGYHSQLSTVFAGVVTAVTGHFTADQAPTLRVEARSRSALLAGPARSRILEQTTDGDLAAAIASDYGLESDTESGRDAGDRRRRPRTTVGHAGRSCGGARVGHLRPRPQAGVQAAGRAFGPTDPRVDPRPRRAPRHAGRRDPAVGGQRGRLGPRRAAAGDVRFVGRHRRARHR